MLFAKGRKQRTAGGGNLQRGKIRLEKGCPLTLRSAPEISGYLSLSVSLNLSAHSSLFSFRSSNGEGDGDGVGG